MNCGYLANEAYQGFIADKSPLSFKNPIFFSCPNSKFAFRRNINTTEMQSKRQLFGQSKVKPSPLASPMHDTISNEAARSINKDLMSQIARANNFEQPNISKFAL